MIAVKIFEFIAYWAVVAIPCSIAFAPAFTSACMVFLLVAYIVKKILKKEKIIARTAIDAPFLAFLTVAVVSIANSVNYADSIRGIYKIIANALLYLILVEEIIDKKHVERIVISMVIGASFAAFDAWWQVVFGWDLVRHNDLIINIGLKRATAAFPNANVLAIYLAPIVPIAFGLARYFFKKRLRLLYAAVGILIFSGLLLTFSRGAAVGCVVGLMIMALVKKDKLIILVLLISLIASPFIAPRNIKDWAKQVNYDPVVFMLNPDRVSIYRNTVNMIRHHPFVGVGVNTFSKNYLTYKLPEPENAKTGEAVYAHNNFLHIAGETGILGVCVFFWLLVKLFSTGAALYKRMQDAYLKLIVLTLLVSLAVFLINGLTETSLYYPRVAMLFWYLAGFLLAMQSLSMREKCIS